MARWQQSQTVAGLSATHPMKTEEKELSRSIAAQSEAQPSIAPRTGFRRFPRTPWAGRRSGADIFASGWPCRLRVQRIAGQRDMEERSLRTRDISSIGVYFFCRRLLIDPGTPVELELLVVDQPIRAARRRMLTEAHIVARGRLRKKPGWHGLAAAFDDISFHRTKYCRNVFPEALNGRRPSPGVSTQKPRSLPEQFLARLRLRAPFVALLGIAGVMLTRCHCKRCCSIWGRPAAGLVSRRWQEPICACLRRWASRGISPTWRGTRCLLQ